ncbi:MAG: hypothetical protein ACQ9ET_05755 [Nitrosomonadaceae bacterium]
MKILLVVLLVISSQAVIAACPKKEMLEFTYMTKEDLTKSYCVNASDAATAIDDNHEASAKWNEFIKELEAGNILVKPTLDIYMSRMERAAEILGCSNDNKENAFRVLRKDHGIEKEEDIKCAQEKPADAGN